LQNHTHTGIPRSRRPQNAYGRFLGKQNQPRNSPAGSIIDLCSNGGVEQGSELNAEHLEHDIINLDSDIESHQIEELISCGTTNQTIFPEQLEQNEELVEFSTPTIEDHSNARRVKEKIFMESQLSMEERQEITSNEVDRTEDEDDQQMESQTHRSRFDLLDDDLKTSVREMIE